MSPASGPEAQLVSPDAKPGRGNGQAGPAATTGAARGEGDRIFASPLARRMAEQAGLDLAKLKGTGPHGRIVKADIEAARSRKPEAAAQPTAAPAAAAPQAAAGPDGGAPAGRDAADGTLLGQLHEIPLTNMRKVIAGG